MTKIPYKVEPKEARMIKDGIYKLTKVPVTNENVYRDDTTIIQTDLFEYKEIQGPTDTIGVLMNEGMSHDDVMKFVAGIKIGIDEFMADNSRPLKDILEDLKASKYHVEVKEMSDAEFNLYRLVQGIPHYEIHNHNHVSLLEEFLKKYTVNLRYTRESDDKAVDHAIDKILGKFLDTFNGTVQPTIDDIKQVFIESGHVLSIYGIREAIADHDCNRFCSGYDTDSCKNKCGNPLTCDCRYENADRIIGNVGKIS